MLSLTSHDVSSLVIDTLCDQASEKNIAVAGFYFDFVAQREQSPTSVLGALLRQIVSGLEEIPEEIVKVYHHQKDLDRGRGPRLPELVKMLRTISSSQCTFLCIDALDECTERCQLDVLNSLQMVLQGSPSTRLFLTGRMHIMDAVMKRFHNKVTVARISPNRKDITRYLRARLDQDPEPDAMCGDLREEILKIIPETSWEMYVVQTGALKLSADRYTTSFSLVSLSIDTILSESTVYRRWRRLNAMTDGLSLRDAYGATVRRIMEQDGVEAGLGMAALMWVFHSERPLRVDELCHALAVEIGSADLDPKNVPSVRKLLNCCQGLLTVDKDASTVRLIHLTLQEYLSTRPDLFARPHSTIAETCLTYLNFQQFKGLPTGDRIRGEPSPRRQRYLEDSVLLEYLSPIELPPRRRRRRYWEDSESLEYLSPIESPPRRRQRYSEDSVSLRYPPIEPPPRRPRYSVFSDRSRDVQSSRDLSLTSDLSNSVRTPFLEYASIYWGTHAKRELSDRARLLALELFDNYNDHVSAQFLLKHISKPDSFDGGGDFSSLTGLHCASFFGIVEVVIALLEMNGCDVNQRGYMGNTPLIWAAENGHEGVVRLLLEREGVNPDRPNDGGQTPLSRAAGNGCEGVVRLLLEREDVNPDKPTDRGQTPLSQAAENGHEGVVRLLLERGDVYPDRPDHRGQTPLSRAAGNGCEGVVRLLLQRGDVRADQPDYEGLTPLSWAVKNGCEGIVKLLLERGDVDPNQPDTMFGQTPLSSAVENGYEGVVRLLLEREDVDPDRQDNILGHTPLLWAAENGYEGVVKLLLEREDVDPNRRGNDGRTPLSRAAWNGHKGVVKLLLSREDADPNYPDAEDQTPLFGAAFNGHEEVVKLLLGREDVDPNRPDMEGQTPLSRAAEEGHEKVVNLLREREGVTPDKPGRSSHTPPLPPSTVSKRARMMVLR